MGQGETGHPDLQGVAGGMRAEWRAEQESAREDAAAQWRHSQKLVDWLSERANAGDRVAVTIYNQRFSGLVEEVGVDLIGLRCPFGRVDVHLLPAVPICIEINDKSLRGGERPRRGRTFHDALRERDARPDTSVGTVHDAEGLDGTLFVGEDFVSVVARLGAETVVPVTSVVWVSARRD
jgi:hypothetical protein